PEDSGPPSTVPDDSAAACWTTWDNVGAPFFSTWCATCHSSALGEARRQGAPLDVNLDSYDGAKSWANLIASELETGAMPPLGSPPQEEIDAVLAWIDCGTPE